VPRHERALGQRVAGRPHGAEARPALGVDVEVHQVAEQRHRAAVLVVGLALRRRGAVDARLAGNHLPRAAVDAAARHAQAVVRLD